MIEFLTLLLGLSAGPQTIELSAGEETVEVRLLVDGETVATDTEPPWSLSFDLGKALRPHLLEAVALGADGREIGRTVQRINLPRPRAEARIVLERTGNGSVVAARLAWESSIRSVPVETRAWLDGVPLEVTQPERIALPATDASEFHLLRVELEFSSDVIAEAEVAFGGAYLDEARADLTAFPVLASRKLKRETPARMAGWFEVPGGPARVVAFEKGELDLVVVRAPGVDDAVGALPGTFDQPVASGGASGPGLTEGAAGVATAVSSYQAAGAEERLQQVMALEPGQRLRLLLPRARSQAGQSVQMEVFALSPEITANHGGLYWALQQELALPGLSTTVQLADAVAVAGLQAANGNRRRAVLLALAEGTSDDSRHSAEEVRDYLASLRVPLLVWRFGELGQGSWPEWGSGETITSFQALRRAARQLSEALDRQRIVWLDGRHLPDSIRISPTAKVVALEP